jgi:hypothetical protein
VVPLRALYATISCTSGFSDFDFAVPASALGKAYSDFLGPRVDLVVSNGAPFVTATEPIVHRLTCLHVMPPENLTCSSNTKSHMQRGNPRTLRARAYILTFWRFMPLLRQTTCVLLRILVVEPSRYFSPLTSPSFVSLQIVT